MAQVDNNEPLNGVVLKGVYVNMKQDDNDSPSAPSNYIDSSLKMISEAGLNHVRFLFYWEAYEKNPELFMKEIESVAKAGRQVGNKSHLRQSSVAHIVLA